MIEGRRFVRYLMAFLIALLVFSFAGWFWTKANRSTKQQIGIPMQAPPDLDPSKARDRQP